MRLLVYLSAFTLLLLQTLTSQEEAPTTKSRSLLVSVPPHKFFVERIARDTAKVLLMVPAGASSHTYEPSPRQMLEAVKADAWFQIGEGFEPKAAKALTSHNPHMRIVDLRQGVSLISSDPNHSHSHHGCSNPNCQDVHFWLSPTQAKVQAKTIASALIELYPENRKLYEKNLSLFLQELDDLDRQIITTLQNARTKTILVSHPAYAYFTRDYGLTQLSIEFEGRDPTPRQLTNLIQEARKAKAATIFIQMQYSNKGAKLIAEKIGAKLVTLDPYSENYLESMREIANAFAQQ